MKNALEEAMKNALEEAIAAANGQSSLAKRMTETPAAKERAASYSQAHIWNWLHRSAGRVPGEHCRAIEEAVGRVVTRHDLRPDIFGPSPTNSDSGLPYTQAGAAA